MKCGIVPGGPNRGARLLLLRCRSGRHDNSVTRNELCDVSTCPRLDAGAGDGTAPSGSVQLRTPLHARFELFLPQCALASACSFSSHRNQTPSRNGGQGGGGSGPEEEGQEGQAGGQEVNFFDALTPLPRPSFLHRSLLGGVY